MLETQMIKAIQKGDIKTIAVDMVNKPFFFTIGKHGVQDIKHLGQGVFAVVKEDGVEVISSNYIVSFTLDNEMEEDIDDNFMLDE